MPVDEGKLRTALAEVFAKFDEDSSGSISSDELGKICKQLDMAMDKSALRKMLAEADPDGSGAIDFDEFVAATKKQIEAGHGGGLADVVQQAGGLFGFFGNLFSFFGGGEAAPEPPSKPAASARPKAAAPKPAPPPPAETSSPPVASTSASPTAMAAAPVAPADSLYDKYMSPAEARANRTDLGHGETRTTRLRATGVKLSCYLNTEVDRGRATVISLPEECDTLGEVLPKIQQQMQLDRRMCYAAELYLPNGDKLITYKSLIDAAALDTGRPKFRCNFDNYPPGM